MPKLRPKDVTKWTIHDVKRFIYEGNSPEDVGIVLGKGAQNTAYRLGSYAVKEAKGAWNCGKQDRAAYWEHKELQAEGFDKIVQWYAYSRISQGNTKYVIQELCIPYCKATLEMKQAMKARMEENRTKYRHQRNRDRAYDLHNENYGITSDGRVIAFDA